MILPIPSDHVAVPGDAHIKLAGLHWLKHYQDGKTFNGYIVLQWQPGVKQWCRAGEHAQNTGFVGAGEYVYVGPCPVPLDETETAALSRLLKSVKYEIESEAVNLRISQKDWGMVQHVLRQLIP